MLGGGVSVQEYLDAWKKYAVFTGRATRNEFWMFLLVDAVVAFLMAGIGVMHNLPWLSNVYGLAVFIPTLAVMARRLQDADFSRWCLLLLIAPIIGWIILAVFLCFPSASDTQYQNTAV